MTDSDQSNVVASWTRTSSELLQSVLKTNQLLFAPLTANGSTATSTAGTTGRRDGDEGGSRAQNEWESTVMANDDGTLSIGDRVAFTKRLDDADVQAFAAVSGDVDPLHLDEKVARRTRFATRIAPEALGVGLVDAAITRLPVLTVCLSRDVEFHNPIRLEERVTAECEVVEDLGNRQYRLRTAVRDDDRTLVDGEAVVMRVDDPTE